MNKTIATVKDVDNLLNIWKVCFTNDALFLNMFFKQCFPLGRTYVMKDNGLIVTSLTMLPIVYAGNNVTKERIQGAYLYGMCTLPSYRGRNLSSQLLEYAEEECKERGIEFIIGRPASPSLFAFYRKLGYNLPIYRNSIEYHLPIFSNGVSYTQIEEESFQRLREKYLESYFIEWKNPMISYILEFIKFNKGSAIVLENDRYMIGYPDEEDTELYIINELGSYSENIKYPTLHLVGNYIKSKYPERTKMKMYFPTNKYYSDVFPTEKEVFALNKPLTFECNPSTFFNFSME